MKKLAAVVALTSLIHVQPAVAKSRSVGSKLVADNTREDSAPDVASGFEIAPGLTQELADRLLEKSYERLDDSMTDHSSNRWADVEARLLDDMVFAASPISDMPEANLRAAQATVIVESAEGTIHLIDTLNLPMN